MQPWRISVGLTAALTGAEDDHRRRTARAPRALLARHHRQPRSHDRRKHRSWRSRRSRPRSTPSPAPPGSPISDAASISRNAPSSAVREIPTSPRSSGGTSRESGNEGNRRSGTPGHPSRDRRSTVHRPARLPTRSGGRGGERPLAHTPARPLGADEAVGAAGLPSGGGSVERSADENGSKGRGRAPEDHPSISAFRALHRTSNNTKSERTTTYGHSAPPGSAKITRFRVRDYWTSAGRTAPPPARTRRARGSTRS